MTTVEHVLETITSHNVSSVLLRFTDLRGSWCQLGLMAERIDAGLLENGILIDGSSIQGWRDVTESDVLLKPDPTAVFDDPFSAQPGLVIFCDVAEPATGLGYERDPRSITLRAQEYLAASSFADRIAIAIDLTFSVFDDARFDVADNAAWYRLKSDEAMHASNGDNAGGGFGHRPIDGHGYMATPPADRLSDLRAEMASVMARAGYDGIYQHHSLAAGQGEVAFGTYGLVEAADRVQLCKYIVHGVAASYGKTATFMPKPRTSGDGASLHTHQSLWSGDQPLFAGRGYADLSETCLHYIGGLIRHGRALNAFTNPTTNSYRRFAADGDSPTLLAYAAHNRSAALRIPYATDGAGKRVEARFVDAAANPYLAFSALLMAGLDGIERRIDPGDAMDRNLYDLPPEEADTVSTVCHTLREALVALQEDHDFLTRGDVMTSDMIATYCDLRQTEVDAIERAPHPLEFKLYYSV